MYDVLELNKLLKSITLSIENEIYSSFIVCVLKFEGLKSILSNQAL